MKAMAGVGVSHATTGVREALTFPKRTAAWVGFRHGKVKAARGTAAFEGFCVFEKGLSMTHALRPGPDQHQPEAGVGRFGKPIRQFDHARQAVTKKQAEVMTLLRITRRWGVGEKLLRFDVRIDRTPGKDPVFWCITVELPHEGRFGRFRLADKHGASCQHRYGRARTAGQVGAFIKWTRNALQPILDSPFDFQGGG